MADYSNMKLCMTIATEKLQKFKMILDTLLVLYRGACIF